MKKVRLTVTQDHINRGIPNDVTCCPIALAIKETLHAEANVDMGYIVVDQKTDNYLHVHTPLRCQEFIQAFDSTAIYESFEDRDAGTFVCGPRDHLSPFEVDLEFEEGPDPLYDIGLA